MSLNGAFIFNTVILCASNYTFLVNLVEIGSDLGKKASQRDRKEKERHLEKKEDVAEIKQEK